MPQPASPETQQTAETTTQLGSLAQLEERFEFLDALRESGKTNMYGAPPYVQKRFRVSRNIAVSITSAWMKSFKPRVPAIDRARAALLKAGAADV